MKVTGFINVNNKVELSDAKITCTLEELDKLIEFFQRARVVHERHTESNGLLLSRYGDWDKNWTKENSNISLETIS